LTGDVALNGTGGGGIACEAAEAVDGNLEGPGRGPTSGNEVSVSDGDAGIGDAADRPLSRGVWERERGCGIVEGGRPVVDATEGGRGAVVIDEVETCLEPSLEGEAVVDLVPARGGVERVLIARGGVEGPALAFGRAVVLAVLEASRDTEAVEACFIPAGRVLPSVKTICGGEDIQSLEPQ
jgi:hypothetical protein